MLLFLHQSQHVPRPHLKITVPVPGHCTRAGGKNAAKQIRLGFAAVDLIARPRGFTDDTVGNKSLKRQFRRPWLHPGYPRRLAQANGGRLVVQHAQNFGSSGGAQELSQSFHVRTV
jgi:hypothetical protein